MKTFSNKPRELESREISREFAPASRVVAAVLLAAIEDYSSVDRNRCVHNSITSDYPADDWINSDNEDPYSFIWCCDQLGYNHEYIRRKATEAKLSGGTAERRVLKSFTKYRRSRGAERPISGAHSWLSGLRGFVEEMDRALERHMPHALVAEKAYAFPCRREYINGLIEKNSSILQGKGGGLGGKCINSFTTRCASLGKCVQDGAVRCGYHKEGCRQKTQGDNRSNTRASGVAGENA